MKFTRRIKTGDPPRYQQELSDEGKQKVEHTPGWPHFDRKGNCICLCRWCLGASGCICRGCAGIGHANCPRADHGNPLTGRAGRERIRI